MTKNNLSGSELDDKILTTNFLGLQDPAKKPTTTPPIKKTIGMEQKERKKKETKIKATTKEGGYEAGYGLNRQRRIEESHRRNKNKILICANDVNKKKMQREREKETKLSFLRMKKKMCNKKVTRSLYLKIRKPPKEMIDTLRRFTFQGEKIKSIDLHQLNLGENQQLIQKPDSKTVF